MADNARRNGRFTKRSTEPTGSVDTNAISAGAGSSTGSTRKPGNIGNPGEDRNGDSGGSRAGSGEIEQENAPIEETPIIRIVEDEDETPRSNRAPRQEAPKPPPKSQAKKPTAKITEAERSSAAKAIAAQACDLANVGVILYTQDAELQMTETERERIEPALANVLKPYDWIVKAKVGSDAGVLAMAVGSWLFRIYVTKQMQAAANPQPRQQAPKRPFDIRSLWKRTAPQNPPQAETYNPNDPPPYIDLSQHPGFGKMGEDAPIV